MTSSTSVSGRQPRIALVSHCLPMGGSTTFLIYLAAGLRRLGIECRIYSFEAENPLAADFAKAGAPVFCTDPSQPFEDRLRLILKELSEFQPTSVVASLGATSFEVLRYLPKGITRLGLVQSDDPNVYPLLSTYALWLDAGAGVSDQIVANIQKLPEMKETPVLNLPYGVVFPETLEREELSPEAPIRILYLGRIEDEQKRVFIFPLIYEQLRAANVPFRWTLAGEGSCREALQAKLPSQPGAEVHFTGTLLRDEVDQLLGKHDLFLLASDYEGLSISLLEAAGYGVVPVVSDLPSGMRQIVREDNGFLIDPNDHEGYGRAMIHLHRHRDELAAKSRKIRESALKEYSLAAMTQRWVERAFTPVGEIAPWPTKFRIQPIVGEEGSFRFSRLGYLLRKGVKSIRR